MKAGSVCLAVALCLTLTAGQAQVASTTPVKGSPYLDEAYVDAEILFATNTRKVPVRYNAYKDLMEYQQNGQALVLDPAPTIKAVRMGDVRFVVEKYEEGGKVKSGYFTLLDTGKVNLYARKEVKFVAAKKGGAMDGSDAPAEFRRNPDLFYFKVGDGSLIEIKNIKTMIAAFPDKQDELTQYAKKGKISPRDEEELRQLVKFYNEL
jgi:hypothetical protein